MPTPSLTKIQLPSTNISASSFITMNHLLLATLLLLFTTTLSVAEESGSVATYRRYLTFLFRRGQNQNLRTRKAKKARRRRRQKALRAAKKCHQGGCNGEWTNLETCDVTCATDGSEVKLFQKGTGNNECVQCAAIPYHDETCPSGPPIANSSCDKVDVGKSCDYYGDCCGKVAISHGCQCTVVEGIAQWMCFEAICPEC